jgi:hypothetical protein
VKLCNSLAPPDLLKPRRQELLEMDVNLRRKQDFWLLVGVAAGLAGFLGYKIGSMPSPPPVVIYVTPVPAPAAK